VQFRVLSVEKKRKTTSKQQENILKFIRRIERTVVSDRSMSLFISKLDTSIVEKSDKCGRTMLHLMAMRGYADASYLLLRMGADPNKADQWGITPLHLAVFVGAMPLVSTLLRFGANPEVRDNSGFTPLFIAISQGDKDAKKLIKKILSKAENAPDTDTVANNIKNMVEEYMPHPSPPPGETNIMPPENQMEISDILRLEVSEPRKLRISSDSVNRSKMEVSVNAMDISKGPEVSGMEVSVHNMQISSDSSYLAPEGLKEDTNVDNNGMEMDYQYGSPLNEAQMPVSPNSYAKFVEDRMAHKLQQQQQNFVGVHALRKK